MEGYKKQQGQAPQESGGRGVVAGLVGFGIGAIMGGVTGLLLAPQSGKETRDKVKHKLGDISDKAGALTSRSKEALGAAKDKMSSAYESASDRTSSFVEKAKTRIMGKPGKD